MPRKKRIPKVEKVHHAAEVRKKKKYEKTNIRPEKNVCDTEPKMSEKIESLITQF